MEFEKVLVHGSEEELNELKSWLFRENIRLDMVRLELEEERKRLEEESAKRAEELDQKMQSFIKERDQFREEMNLLHQRSSQERQRLKQEAQFFDKKMEILKNGFAELERDRKELEREKIRLRSQAEVYREMSYPSSQIELLFYGADTLMLLKKRYKDLVKIFHPDNVAGDSALFKQITEMYEQLQVQYRKDMHA